MAYTAEKWEKNLLKSLGSVLGPSHFQCIKYSEPDVVYIRTTIFQGLLLCVSEESKQQVLQRPKRNVGSDQLAEALELHYAVLCGVIETQPQQKKANFVLV